MVVAKHVETAAMEAVQMTTKKEPSSSSVWFKNMGTRLSSAVTQLKVASTSGVEDFHKSRERAESSLRDFIIRTKC